MADEGQELRRVNWREVFGFTNIFNSFRLSRQWTKMVIAVAAVVLTWLIGSGLDIAFFGSNVHVLRGGAAEPDAYWQVDDFSAVRKQAADQAEAALVNLAQANLVKRSEAAEYRVFENAAKAAESAKDSPGYVRGLLEDCFADALDKAFIKARDDRKAADERIDKMKDDEVERTGKTRSELKQDVETAYVESRQRANSAFRRSMKQLEDTEEKGVFETFAEYEGYYFRQAVDAVLQGNIFTGFNSIAQQRAQGAQQGLQQLNVVPPARLCASAPGQNTDPLGMLAALALMVEGVVWLCCAHWLYALVFGVLMLALWSLTIGAIARAAALQATRDEKAPIKECIVFAIRKWGSFVTPPLFVAVVVLVLGVLSAVIISAPGAIPWFGGIWIGVLFGLALLVGAVLSLLVILGVAGSLLMAPTVAVEGSDTFDALSRSYEFAFTRPWRAGFYGLVAAVYGTICYLFVRFFLFVTLLLAHWIVSIFTAFTDGSTVASGASKWDLMYPGPTFENFHGGDILPAATRGFGGGEYFGSYMVHLWIGLVAAVLTAWVISYLVSASTWIYLLLRRVSDATELDEVYIEEPEEDWETPAPAESEPQAPQSAEPPAESEPPAKEAGDEKPAEGEGEPDKD